MRITFVTSPEGKEKVLQASMPGNVDKIKSAPVTAIIAYDMAFFENYPRLARIWNPRRRKLASRGRHRELALRNSSLQAGFLMTVARSMGLDCGPMSGFKNAVIDERSMPAGWRSNFLLNLGYGDGEKLHPRAARLDFDEAARSSDHRRPVSVRLCSIRREALDGPDVETPDKAAGAVLGIQFGDQRVMAWNDHLRTFRQGLNAVIAAQHLLDIDDNRKRCSSQEILVVMRGVRRQAHPPHRGFDSHHLQPFRMSANAVDRDAVGDLVILAIEADPPGEHRLYRFANMVTGEGLAKNVLAHAGAGGIGHFGRLQMEGRTRE